MTVDINNEWLGQMQRELGTQLSNIMLNSIVIEDQRRRIETDAALIEALKVRIKEAESANVELKAFIRKERKQAESTTSWEERYSTE